MKEILKQFKWLILFCLVSPFIVYIILITPSPIGIVAREDVGALLGYYGAILGGFMTLAGVWWTIYDHKNEVALLNEPVLTITNRSVKTEVILDSEILYIYLDICNDGPTMAKSISINFDEPKYNSLTKTKNANIKIFRSF